MLKQRFARFRQRIFPGFILAALIGMSAQFIGEHTNSPVMLMALLLGMVMNFVTEEAPDRVLPGLDFSAKTILKFGIVLLGARISADKFLALGWEVIALVASALLATLAFGLVVGQLLKKTKSFSILTAGAVSICGASAALAIISVLPPSKDRESQLGFTILSVTLFSTIAMIIYPVILKFFGFNDVISGVVLGATIHDVAQVVGAGFSMSDETGEVATLVKLIRVSLLAPFVLILALSVRSTAKKRAALSASPEKQSFAKAPLVPVFVIGFIVFVVLNSFHVFPETLQMIFNIVSRGALIMAIAAVGVKTSLKTFLSMGRESITLILSETVFIFVFVIFTLTVVLPAIG